MTTFILWAFLVLDGNETLVQERFGSEEACRQGIAVMSQMADRSSYAKLRDAQCIPSGMQY